jgi:tetratricopeptide (TPR) repeat protein
LSVPLLTELDLLGEGLEEVGELAEPLQGMELCAGAAFGHWVDRTREALLRRAREVLVQAVRDGRVEGCLEKVYRLALLLHRLDPVEPVAVLALAERALVDGDTIGAMRVMKEYLARVQAELGANPHPEIAALLRRLERGEGPALVFTGRFGIAPRMPREVFVSREQEIAQLEALWQQVGERVCQTCVIAGVAGIGKSTLARRFAMSVAARALPVYVVACQEIGAGIPFAAVADLILALGSDPLVSGTDPRWLAEASRVSPSLRSIYPGVPEPPPAPAESVRIRVADALVAMLESVSDGRPVLLVFDDVHHMDPASRDVLFLVTRRLERVHVVILGTLRAGDGSGTGWGREVGTLWWENWIRLGPLDDASVSRMVDLLVGEAGPVEGRVRERVLRLAQGNPYHAELLLTDWRQRGDQSLVMVEESGAARGWEWNPPDTFRSAFLAQYHDVSETARHVLHLLAVAARSMSAAEIAEVLNLQVRAVETVLLSPIERGLLRIEGGRFQFKNDLQRAFLYYFMPADLRKLHHKLLAQGAWARHEGQEFKNAAEASHHFICADMPAEATATALESAKNAVLSGAFREALKVLTALLDAYQNPENPWVYLFLARAALSLGDYDRATSALASWSFGEDPQGDAFATQLRAEVIHRTRTADDETIATATERAIAVAEAACAEDVLSRALMIAAEAAWDRGDLVTLEAVSRRADQLAATAADTHSAAVAIVARSYSQWGLGDFASTVRGLEAVIPIFKGLAMQNDLRQALNGLGVTFTSLGRFSEAIRAFQNAIEIAGLLGDELALALAWSNLGSLYTDLGWFNDAVRALRSAISAESPAQIRLGAEVYANAMWLAIHLGNLEEAEQFAEHCDREASRSHLWRHRALALLCRADLLLARGSPELAWPLVEQAIRVVGSKAHVLYDVGQYHRLALHFTWSTQGIAATRPWLNPVRRSNYRRVTDWLEIQAMAQWVLQHGGTDHPQALNAVVTEIETTGALGLLSRLIAVGCSPVPLAQAPKGEPPALILSRLYPSPQREHIPTSVLGDG